MALLERSDSDGIAHLNLNAPEKLNALSEAMLDALQSQFNVLQDDRSVRAVVISGAGKAFCAGHDLKEMTAGRQAQDGGKAYFKHLFDKCAQMMTSIPKLPQPVVAQVHGIATAAGCQLVASCDLAVAGQGTQFGVNGVNIGLFCSTPMVALTRNIPRKAAFEMLTTGRFIDTNEAQSLGLINNAVPEPDLAEATKALATTIATKLPSAVRYGKAAFYAQAEIPTADAYAFTGDIMVANMADDATNEGINAFIEKRPPNWS